jgi:hypothetical protein
MQPTARAVGTRLDKIEPPKGERKATGKFRALHKISERKCTNFIIA